jgi:hypothetical protein
MMVEIRSSERLVLTRTMRRHILEDGILQKTPCLNVLIRTKYRKGIQLRGLAFYWRESFILIALRERKDWRSILAHERSSCVSDCLCLDYKLVLIGHPELWWDTDSKFGVELSGICHVSFASIATSWTFGVQLFEAWQGNSIQWLFIVIYRSSVTNFMECTMASYF